MRLSEKFLKRNSRGHNNLFITYTTRWILISKSHCLRFWNILKKKYCLPVPTLVQSLSDIYHSSPAEDLELNSSQPRTIISYHQIFREIDFTEKISSNYHYWCYSYHYNTGLKICLLMFTPQQTDRQNHFITHF